MRFIFAPIDEASARSIMAWRYDGPYAIYNLDGVQALRALLAPQNAYYAITDERHELVAFACFGPDARVPGGDYAAGALDVGLGLRPDLTGRGLGLGLVEAILDFAQRTFAPAAFRLTVAAFNRRALRVYERAGFRPVQTFAHTRNGKLFVVLLRQAEESGTRAPGGAEAEPRQLQEYTAANRQAWNQAAPIHERQHFDQLVAAFRKPGHSCLDATATALLQQAGLRGRSVAHLCCNNGRELLSVKNLGAGRCVGFDISDAFIEQAHRLARAAAIDCEFVRTDICDIPAAFASSFDLVLVTVGTLGWMPELRPFFQVVARILRPGAFLALYEMHPILDMFDEEEGDPPPLRHSYFREVPYRDETGLDYYGGTTYRSLPTFWFHHKLSQVIGGCLDSGLAIFSFEEYGHDVSNAFAHLERVQAKPPLSYTLLARKAG